MFYTRPVPLDFPPKVVNQAYPRSFRFTSVTCHLVSLLSPAALTEKYYVYKEKLYFWKNEENLY